MRVEEDAQTEPTFHVEGHHYGLVQVEGLECGAYHRYEVQLDGEKVWPEPDSGFPPSRFRTYPKGKPLEIAFGSCRVAVPNEEPYTLQARTTTTAVRELDALRAMAFRMRDAVAGGLAGHPAAAGRPGVRRRGLAAHAGVREDPPRRGRGAGPAGAGLRGVHPPVQRVVGRPGDPLAALHGLDGDDLRRPRRARRLEHLRRVGGGDAQDRLVGRAHRGRADELLDLPAPRQPEPRRAGRERHLRARARGRGCRPDPARVRAARRPRGGGHAVDLPPRPRRHAADHDRLPLRARAQGRRAPDARRRRVGLDLRPLRGRLRPPAAGHVAALAAVAGHAPPRGLERGRLRRRLGRPGREAGREAAPGHRPRALGRLPRLLRAAGRAPARGRARARRASRPRRS